MTTMLLTTQQPTAAQDIYLFIYWLETFPKIDFPKENKWRNGQNAQFENRDRKH